jgi:UDP-N-acetyl-2-amino-2-deoxyglucuronate dehydrogenase
MKKTKFALIGCGRISRKHIEAIQANPNQAVLVAVCDVEIDRAMSAGNMASVPFYDNYDEMLKSNPEIEVVNILTPSGNHASVAIDVVSKYQKHIVVEKPMALKLSDADRMIRICDKNGVKLFVVKQNRYNLPVQKVREALVNGRFGKIVMASVRVRWSRDQAYYDQDAWRGTWASDGGVFSNQASHHVDLLEWMLGSPVSVYAISRTALVDIETEDTGVAIITFESGAIGLVEATTAVRPKDLEGSLSILGEMGSVEIGGFAVNEMKVWNFIDEAEGDDSVIEKYSTLPANVYGFGHEKYIQNVCDSLQHNHSALVDGLEGRKSLELINAIYESIETGVPVNLKFSPKYSKLGLNMGKSHSDD